MADPCWNYSHPLLWEEIFNSPPYHDEDVTDNPDSYITEWGRTSEGVSHSEEVVNSFRESVPKTCHSADSG
jgi:hypothetical protein